MKKSVKILIAILGIVGIIAVCLLLPNSKQAPEPKISLSTTIQEVRSIGKLVTATFYRESGAFVKRDGERIDVFIIAKGKVNAGFDLMNMNENDIVCEGDTLYLTVPQPEIFNVIANPNDFEILADKKNGENEFRCNKQLQDSDERNHQSQC